MRDRRIFISATRAPLVRRIVAICHYYGWPRSPTASEVQHPGGGTVDAAIRAGITWRWWSRIRTLSDGRFAIILDVAHPRLVEVDGMTLTVPATYAGFAVPGGAGTVTIDLSVGVALAAEHHDAAESDPA